MLQMETWQLFACGLCILMKLETKHLQQPQGDLAAVNSCHKCMVKPESVGTASKLG